MLTPEYENLLARYFSGEAGAAERSAVDAWRKTSAENQRLFEDYANLWRESGAEAQPHAPNIDQAWLELENKLGLPKTQSPARILHMKKTEPRVSAAQLLTWNKWSGMLAAAAVLTLVFGTLLYKSWHNAPTWQTVVVSNAEQRKVELPDGSWVTLNSGSSLEYPLKFDAAEREVKLAGEGFFEVARDTVHPFLVNTANAQIKVLGTKFSVWSRQAETRVIVREGRVALREEQEPRTAVELTANQMSIRRAQNAPEPPRAIDAGYALGWLEGRIVFDQAALVEVVAELQRVYNVEIALAKPALAQHTITGSFNRKPIASVLASICLTLNLKYQQEGGKYIITE